MTRPQQTPWYLPGLVTARVAWPGKATPHKLDRTAGSKYCECGKATIVLTTRTTEHGDIWRVRECPCGSRYESIEVVISRGTRKEKE
jgi:hypothetical protein